jgi:hypothetical protein
MKVVMVIFCLLVLGGGILRAPPESPLIRSATWISENIPSWTLPVGMVLFWVSCLTFSIVSEQKRLKTHAKNKILWDAYNNWKRGDQVLLLEKEQTELYLMRQKYTDEQIISNCKNYIDGHRCGFTTFNQRIYEYLISGKH